MEEEIYTKIKSLKQDIIKLSENKDFFRVNKDESWESYLDRLLDIKRPNSMTDSFIFISIILDNFKLSDSEKKVALKKLGFHCRS
jgi:hypothetical protein